jgi:hypothetical protein
MTGPCCMRYAARIGSTVVFTGCCRTVRCIRCLAQSLAELLAPFSSSAGSKTTRALVLHIYLRRPRSLVRRTRSIRPTVAVTSLGSRQVFRATWSLQHLLGLVGIVPSTGHNNLKAGTVKEIAPEVRRPLVTTIPSVAVLGPEAMRKQAVTPMYSMTSQPSPKRPQLFPTCPFATVL